MLLIERQSTARDFTVTRLSIETVGCKNFVHTLDQNSANLMQINTLSNFWFKIHINLGPKYVGFHRMSDTFNC